MLCDICIVNIRYQDNKADVNDAVRYSCTCLLQFPPKELDLARYRKVGGLFFARFSPIIRHFLSCNAFRLQSRPDCEDIFVFRCCVSDQWHQICALRNDLCKFVMQNPGCSIKILSLKRIEGTPARNAKALRAFFLPLRFFSGGRRTGLPDCGLSVCRNR